MKIMHVTFEAENNFEIERVLKMNPFNSKPLVLAVSYNPRDEEKKQWRGLIKEGGEKDF